MTTPYVPGPEQPEEVPSHTANWLPPQQPQYYPQPQPAPKKSRKGLWIGISVAVALLLACGAVFGGSDGDGKDAMKVQPFIAGSATTRPAPTQTTEAPKPVLTKKDIILKVKILSNKCFGSAGCNVQYQVQAGWDEGKVSEGEECEVTYKVKGSEYGAETDTLIINDDGTYMEPSESFTSAKKKSTKFTASVTEVECS